MEIPSTAPLFAWACMEDSPSLQTVHELLAAIPDRELLQALRDHRGHGRNDYPIESLWGVLLLTVALRHPTVEACLAELQRNRGLRLLIGIDSEDDVPKKWNVSRFQKMLGQEPFLTLQQKAFGQMVTRLGQAVPTLGQRSAGDSTGLSARQDSKPAVDGLPPPDGGRKEYFNADGSVSHVVEWFGYKLHLVVDARHEVALAYQVTSTTTGDGETLPSLVERAAACLPEDRIRSLAYDMAADSVSVHEWLHEHGIAPVIQTRDLWKENPDRPLPGRNQTPVRITYDEAGSIFCWDSAGKVPVRRSMIYFGHEKNRGTLKYRCPAAVYDWDCGCERKCNAGKVYGLTVRVKQEIDLRRFPQIPRATQTFERLYRGRTAVERVNARLKILWGADDGNIAGAGRFHALIGTVMLVHLAFATVLASTPRRPVTLGVTALQPVQKALRATTPKTDRT